MYSLELLVMGGKTVPNMQSVIQKKCNKFEKLLHLVGFTIEIINDIPVRNNGKGRGYGQSY
jgi:hypothetical protein